MGFIQNIQKTFFSKTSNNKPSTILCLNYLFQTRLECNFWFGYLLLMSIMWKCWSLVHLNRSEKLWIWGTPTTHQNLWNSPLATQKYSIPLSNSERISEAFLSLLFSVAHPTLRIEHCSYGNNIATYSGTVVLSTCPLLYFTKSALAILCQRTSSNIIDVSKLNHFVFCIKAVYSVVRLPTFSALSNIFSYTESYSVGREWTWAHYWDVPSLNPSSRLAILIEVLLIYSTHLSGYYFKMCHYCLILQSSQFSMCSYLQSYHCMFLMLHNLM
jgi:hypothetical protein